MDPLEDIDPALYETLRTMAAGYMAGQRHPHTLQPTALVHEAYVKLNGCLNGDSTQRSKGRGPWNDDVHFLACTARAMRQILVDHARRRQALKRAGNRRRWTIADSDACTGGNEIELVPLDDALTRLGEIDPRKCRVVELRFFAGMTVAETARVLGASASTIESEWRFARAWLRDRLSGSEV
jgi:RNA polymerase sigma factor (TIGR02999 family)